MKKIHLRVIFPKNRNLLGWLQVGVDGVMVAEFRALGRGSRGAGDTSLQTKGNTPTGEYSGQEVVETSQWNQSSYGPWGAVRLDPTAGSALLAEMLGRTGLLIHGGSLANRGPWKDSLKPTYGCIRVSNDDMKSLREIIEEAQDDGQSCRQIVIEVTVTEQ